MTCTGGEFDVWLFPPSKQNRSSTSQLLRYVQGILNAGLKALFKLSVRESWKSWRDPYLKTDRSSGKLQHSLLKIFLRRFYSTAMVTKDAFFSLFALPEQSSSLLYGSSINSFDNLPVRACGVPSKHLFGICCRQCQFHFRSSNPCQLNSHVPKQDASATTFVFDCASETSCGPVTVVQGPSTAIFTEADQP